MITVHHLRASQSERIVWLCAELSIPFALQCYDRDPRTRLAPADYKALHPMGIAPVVTDDGLVLAESGAIVEYLMAKYGDGRLSVGAGQANFASYLFWFHFANGTMMPSIVDDAICGMLNDKESNPAAAMFKDRNARAFALVEQRLRDAPYLAGADFSAADIMMVFPLTTMRIYARRDLARLPHIRAYLQRIGGRQGYQRAMAKGDPEMRPMLT